ncbi:TonB-dependent receptor [Segatella albensis]|uniref:TonB-dependent receptor n=1 Tax=Segatella albensis TaxID=77768 RepID=UPI0004698978|nr:carboxypeptidase regulatory-like domain-containing protein [Segatella albensis]
MQKRLRFLMALMLFFTTSIMAQVTTSSMSGSVTEKASKEPIIGAAIQIVHEPSGTRYSAVSNIDGRFNIQGMRPGGPYTVTISYVGFSTMKFKNITLQLGNPFSLDAEMTEDAKQLGEVVVIAQGTKFAAKKTGAATNISNTQIMNMPNVSRSLTDVARLSPYGGNGMSFAGTDGRTANFTVDGANFNNNFGLNDGLPGGGTPISLDAIEEMQVVISPYDVRQTNFVGGGINAITKSGTNKFKGTAYAYHRNENMRGDAIDGVQIPTARETDRTSTYGFTLGGPIVKDKLFFFVNGETVQTPSVANRWRGSKDGVADVNRTISRTTLSDLQKVSDFVRNEYGYDTGSYTDFPSDITNDKFLARLDWNITDKHRLAIRYNYTKNTKWIAPNASSMDGGTRSAFGRTSEYSMSFANSMYSMDNLVKTWSFDLNSRLTDNLSNQFLATYSKLDDVRGTKSDEFPFIDILKDGENYMALGYELFTYNNAVHNTVWNVKDDLNYTFGNHRIFGGVSYEHQMADNQYMRNGTGYYRYSSLDDFLNKRAPEIVCLTYGYNGETSPAARVQFNKLGVYAQDEWNVNKKFMLTYGIRFDGLFFENKDLMRNQAIYDLDYSGRHIDTGKWPNSSLTINPRVGFTYDVFGDGTLKFRGGTGLFSGRLPLVFFTNMPTNGGLVQYQAQINEKEATKKGFTMDEFAGGLVTDANKHATVQALKDKLEKLGYPMTVSPTDGTVPSSISAVDPNFKLPQRWKTSLAVDYQLPTSFPLSVTGEFIFNKTVYESTMTDWSMISPNGFEHFNGVDNRPLFPETFRQGTKAFVLENTSKGWGYQASIQVNAQPVEGINLMAAYTHTVSKDVTGMPGSNAESCIAYVPSVQGPNNVGLHNSQYTTPDRIVASATFNDKSGNTFSFIYEGFKGGYNYSYMTANDMNGDGYKYDLIYVPTDEQVEKGQFRFVSEDDKTRFMDFVHGDSYLKHRQGKYAEAYSVYSPWVHRLDVAYKHDFKLKLGATSHKLQLSFDVKNVLNMFNDKWGVSKMMNASLAEGRILNYEGMDAEGYATFSTPKAVSGNTQRWVYNHAIGQCWYASVGIKYFFN